MEIKNEVVAITNELIDKNLQITMGYSDFEGYSHTYFRPLLWPILKNNLLDPVALMELQNSGSSLPNATIAKFANQEFDIVIVPKQGEPFSMENWYAPHSPLFGNLLPEVFAANYHIFKKYHYFNLWQANRLSFKN
jgi:hypothetical protein